MHAIGRFILLFLFVIWFIGLFVFVHSIPEKPIETNATADAAIVLTGGDKRIAEGVKLLKQKKVKKLFITGVNERVKHKKEIPFLGSLNKVDSIEIGQEATTTNSNALEAKDWIEKNNIKSIKIVTANYHMPRSILEFKRYIPEVKIEPYPVFPEGFNIKKWWYDTNTIVLVLKEYTKYIYILCYISII